MTHVPENRVVDDIRFCTERLRHDTGSNVGVQAGHEFTTEAEQPRYAPCQVTVVGAAALAKTSNADWGFIARVLMFLFTAMMVRVT